MAELLARYDQQVKNGLAAGPVGPPEPGRNTEAWRFLTDWRVPSGKNQAERLVRPAKVKLKVIGGFLALGVPRPSACCGRFGKPTN